MTLHYILEDYTSSQPLLQEVNAKEKKRRSAATADAKKCKMSPVQRQPSAALLPCLSLPTLHHKSYEPLHKTICRFRRYSPRWRVGPYLLERRYCGLDIRIRPLAGDAAVDTLGLLCVPIQGDFPAVGPLPRPESKLFRAG